MPVCLLKDRENAAGFIPAMPANSASRPIEVRFSAIWRNTLFMEPDISADKSVAQVDPARTFRQHVAKPAELG